MQPEDAVRRCQEILAHAWMVRTYLKHADEIQEDEVLIEVPRTLYDSIRAVEPAFLRNDWPEYLRRLRGKLGKIRRIAEMFERDYRRVSTHTNFEMAALSLRGVVRELTEVFERLQQQPTSEATDDAP